MSNELGARIRMLRRERGLTQEALAQALEVSRQAVTKWEDGSSLPSTANLFALAVFFSVPLAELTGTPESTSPAPPATGVSEKERRTRTKFLTIGACVLLAVSVPVLLWCAVQHFNNASLPIPEPYWYSVPSEEEIIGAAETITGIYVISKFPTWLFLSAVSLFAVGVGVLFGLLFKRWKGKSHDRQR